MTVILGYNVEGTKLCNECLDKHIQKHFPSGNKEEIKNYLENQSYPLTDDDYETYGEIALKDECEECNVKLHELPEESALG